MPPKNTPDSKEKIRLEVLVSLTQTQKIEKDQNRGSQAERHRKNTLQHIESKDLVKAEASSRKAYELYPTMGSCWIYAQCLLTNGWEKQALEVMSNHFKLIEKQSDKLGMDAITIHNQSTAPELKDEEKHAMSEKARDHLTKALINKADILQFMTSTFSNSPELYSFSPQGFYKQMVVLLFFRAQNFLSLNQDEFALMDLDLMICLSEIIEAEYDPTYSLEKIDFYKDYVEMCDFMRKGNRNRFVTKNIKKLQDVERIIGAPEYGKEIKIDENMPFYCMELTILQIRKKQTATEEKVNKESLINRVAALKKLYPGYCWQFMSSIYTCQPLYKMVSSYVVMKDNFNIPERNLANLRGIERTTRPVVDIISTLKTHKVNQALSYVPKDETIKRRLEHADLLYIQKDYLAAYREYSQFVGSDELLNKYLYFQLGLCCKELKDTSGAARYFNKILVLDAMNIKAINQLIFCYKDLYAKNKENNYEMMLVTLIVFSDTEKHKYVKTPSLIFDLAALGVHELEARVERIRRMAYRKEKAELIKEEKKIKSDEKNEVEVKVEGENKKNILPVNKTKTKKNKNRKKKKEQEIKPQETASQKSNHQKNVQQENEQLKVQQSQDVQQENKLNAIKPQESNPLQNDNHETLQQENKLHETKRQEIILSEIKTIDPAFPPAVQDLLSDIEDFDKNAAIFLKGSFLIERLKKLIVSSHQEKQGIDIDFAYSGSPQAILEAIKLSSAKLGRLDSYTVSLSRVKLGLVRVTCGGYTIDIYCNRSENADAELQSINFKHKQILMNVRDKTIRGCIADVVNPKDITAVGNPRLQFQGDPVRVLQAFYVSLNDNIPLSESVADGLHDGDVLNALSNKLSPDEANANLRKILLHGRNGLGFNLLMDNGILKRFFGEHLTFAKNPQLQQFVRHFFKRMAAVQHSSLSYVYAFFATIILVNQNPKDIRAALNALIDNNRYFKKQNQYDSRVIMFFHKIYAEYNDFVAANPVAVVRPPIKTENETKQHKEDKEDKDYARGKQLYIDKNYGEAFKYFEKAAMKNHHNAQACIGCLYDQGRGVSQDILKAAEYYYQAIQGDIAFALHYLGQLMDQHVMVREKYASEISSIELYHRAVKLGTTAAYLDLAYCFDGYCIGVERDIKMAYKYYKLAVENGIFAAHEPYIALARELQSTNSSVLSPSNTSSSFWQNSFAMVSPKPIQGNAVIPYVPH